MASRRYYPVCGYPSSRPECRAGYCLRGDFTSLSGRQRMEDDSMVLAEALTANDMVTEEVHNELLALVRDGGQWIVHAPPTYWLRLILLRRLRGRQVTAWTNDVSDEWSEITLRGQPCEARWYHYTEEPVQNSGEGDHQLEFVLGMKQADIGAETHVFVHHGTTAAKLPSILHSVRIDRNDRDSDFDFGPGFYTNYDSELCAQWAIQKVSTRGGIPAVIGFAIPQEKWDCLDRLNFSLPEHEDDWWESVSSCRNSTIPNELMPYDVAEGPMWGNPGSSEINATRVSHQLLFRVVRVLNSYRKFFVLIDSEI